MKAALTKHAEVRLFFSCLVHDIDLISLSFFRNSTTVSQRSRSQTESRESTTALSAAVVVDVDVVGLLQEASRPLVSPVEEVRGRMAREAEAEELHEYEYTLSVA